MKNVNIDKIKSCRGRPKGSKKPFWSFLSQRKLSGKRERDLENETNINMNKKAKIDDNFDIIIGSSLHSKEETS